jgi:hypothetical protein
VGSARDGTGVIAGLGGRTDDYQTLAAAMVAVEAVRPDRDR